MTIRLHDNGLHAEFAPLTLMKPVGRLRSGLMTIQERWALHFPEANFVYQTESYLEGKFPNSLAIEVSVASNVLPNEELVNAIKKTDDAIIKFDGYWLATVGNGTNTIDLGRSAPIILHRRWDLCSPKMKP